VLPRRESGGRWRTSFSNASEFNAPIQVEMDDTLLFLGGRKGWRRKNLDDLAANKVDRCQK
jgi:hypothetical protein